MEILGVRVDNLTRKEALEKVSLFLNEPNPHQIATVNPEFILEAEKNEEFKNILNSCDLNIADGVGLKLAFWKKGERLKERISGSDLLEDILRLAVEHELRVFCAVRKDGLSSLDEIIKALEKKGTSSPLGEKNGLDVGGMELSKNERNLNIDNYDILLCNFGAPDQEMFLRSAKGDRMRLAIGVGGSFDFITGKLKRAPLLMRKSGLEWLFRLIQQPKRIKRIWKAAVIFPIKILFQKNE